MSRQTTARLIPLTDAAYMAGERYRTLYDKALGGMLGPLVREDGRIYVTARGVQAYLAKRAAGSPLLNAGA